MPKFEKSYKGQTLRGALFSYSVDRSRVDPVFKRDFDTARAEERRQRAARDAERRAKENKEHGT